MIKNASRKMRKVAKDNGGELPYFAFPGGYPMFYLDRDNNVLCPKCANQNDEYDPPIVEYDINYEDDFLFCDHCSKQIESAYGD